MKRDINIIIANPAGNITIFVLDKFNRCDYQAVANQLLQQPDLGGEQVAFVKSLSEMDMCGLEFCGNASRAFGLLVANFKKIKGSAKIDVNVSGSDEMLTVDVDTNSGYTKVKMPMARSVYHLVDTGIDEIDGMPYVDLGGIGHVVLTDVNPTDELFNRIKCYINKTFNPPAMGVMFYDTVAHKLTPIVYVAGVDTTYWEGSCGSGSTAVALALCENENDGTYQYTLQQPAGVITVSVEKYQGRFNSVYIEGTVELSETKTIKIDC